MKPLYLTSIGNIFVIQPFLTRSRRCAYFSNLHWCTQSIFSYKGPLIQQQKTLLKFTAQIISECSTVNTISVQNMNWCFESVTCQTIKQWPSLLWVAFIVDIGLTNKGILCSVIVLLTQSIDWDLHCCQFGHPILAR